MADLGSLEAKMRFEVLGPLRVWIGTSQVKVPSGMAQRLLGALLSRSGDSIPVAELIDALWPSEPPSKARKDLQVLIHKPRRVLREPERVIFDSGGYAIVVKPGELNASDFADYLRRSDKTLQADDLDGSLEHLDHALNLWRGRPYGGLEESRFLGPEIQRLNELRLQALEYHLEATTRRGRHAEAIARLSALVAEHPYRERFAELHMLALYRSGRQADALDVYQQVRRRLIDDLGIEPSYAIHQLHERILRRDPMLWPTEQHQAGQRELFEPPAIPMPEKDNILNRSPEATSGRGAVSQSHRGRGRAAAADRRPLGTQTAA